MYKNIIKIWVNCLPLVEFARWQLHTQFCSVHNSLILWILSASPRYTKENKKALLYKCHLNNKITFRRNIYWLNFQVKCYSALRVLHVSGSVCNWTRDQQWPHLMAVLILKLTEWNTEVNTSFILTNYINRSADDLNSEVIDL